LNIAGYPNAQTAALDITLNSGKQDNLTTSNITTGTISASNVTASGVPNIAGYANVRTTIDGNKNHEHFWTSACGT
jgi:hypothetical protein